MSPRACCQLTMKKQHNNLDSNCRTAGWVVNDRGRPVLNQLVTGERARPAFLSHMTHFFKDAATESLLVSKRIKGELITTPCTVSMAKVVFTCLGNDRGLDDVELICLEGRNSPGDAWKSTFYPGAQATVFIAGTA